MRLSRPTVVLLALTTALTGLPALGVPGLGLPTPAGAAPGDQLLVNGSFEDPVLPAASIASYGKGQLPGWEPVGSCRIEVQRDAVAPARDGAQLVELAEECATSIEQRVATVPGATYALSYALAPRPGVVRNAAEVLVDGEVVRTVESDGTQSEAVAWRTYTETVVAQGTELRLGFREVPGGDEQDPFETLGTLLDDVRLVEQSRPEPSAPPYRPEAEEAVAQNTSWTTAALLPEATDTAGSLGGAGEARWFRFPVVPGSSVQVDLTGLAADADLTLFRDIGAAFTALSAPETDLPRLGAEFAGDAYAPSAHSPSIYSPSIYSPSIYSPSIYSPSIYSPSIYSPSIYSPSIYSPSIYSPSIYSPSIYSPSSFDPGVQSPSAAFLDAFSSAQTRSLVVGSARDGVADEVVRTATHSATGEFYVRVQSRDGAAATPFTVRLTTSGGPCTGLSLDTGSSVPLPPTPGTPTTVVLTDTARLGLTGAARSAFLATLRGVGTVVDAADVERTRRLNAQADAHPRCAYAKNLVAQSLRDVVNGYRANGPGVTYVVVAGGDPVVPFFRYADEAGLGPESDFVPPLQDGTAAEAALRSNQVLGQDAYGAVDDLQVKGSVLPVPDLAVGRLVETPAEITAQVERFRGLADGTLPRPRSSLVTGYDFLTSAADAVQADLVAGLGAGARTDALITDQGVPTTTTTVGGAPDRAHSWTATDLRSALLGSRHDLVFLAGHFGASDALAADYRTSLSTADVAAARGLFTDSLVFSAGCHSGYGVPDADGVPGLTDAQDWAQTMAQQQAVLVAGTGYQYADTDFLAYSAKLYTQFTEALREGTPGTPVRVGQALVQAKQDYLAGLTSLTGIDTKSVLQATLYGLPMTGVDLPERATAPATGAPVAPEPVAAGTPGAVLGLQSAPLTSTPDTTVRTRAVEDLQGRPTGARFRWLEGPDGVRTSPAVPALPLETTDVTSDDGSVLRGVGFRSGTYTDTPGTTPLTGAPVTEKNGLHTSFGATAFFPARLASPNFFGALASTGDGRTRLQVTPAQHRADPSGTTVTERRYDELGLELFYSSSTATFAGNTPALAAPPSLSQVGAVAQPDGTLAFSVRVTGDPSAGVQSAWVTYTATSGPLAGRWASLDLTQSASDSTLWTGTLPLPAGQDATAVRFVAQAVNGVGLVSLDDARADGYVPVVAGAPAPAPRATSIAVGDRAPVTGRHAATVSVPLRTTGLPSGTRVQVEVGSAVATAVTRADGTATVALPLRTPVGTYRLTASYAGDALRAPSSTTTQRFTVQKAETRLRSSPQGSTISRAGDPSRWFVLTTEGQPMVDKPVLLQVYDKDGRRVQQVTRRTDLLGRIHLGGLALPAGRVQVFALFGAASAGSTPDPTYASSIWGLRLTAT